MCLPAAAFAALGASSAAGTGLFGASMATTLATAGSVAGLGLSTYSSYAQAKGQQNMARYNAAVAENNAAVADRQAQDALQRGEREAQDVRRQADQVKGQQRATMAARGLELTEGTSADILNQTDFFGLTDVARTRQNAAREAYGMRTQAGNFRSEAGMQRTTARNINPLMQAGTTLLSSAGSVADRWYSPRT